MTDTDAWPEFTEVADLQGWTTVTRLDVALGFISRRELDDQLALYAQGIADEENGEEET